MDLKQIGSASSLGETAIHIDKIASCNVEIPHLSSYMQEIAKKHLACFSHIVYNTFI